MARQQSQSELVLNRIMAYENGELNQREQMSLIVHLICTRLAWYLHDAASIEARRLVAVGVLDMQGNLRREESQRRVAVAWSPN